jgi:hypothetical protein
VQRGPGPGWSGSGNNDTFDPRQCGLRLDQQLPTIGKAVQTAVHLLGHRDEIVGVANGVDPSVCPVLAGDGERQLRLGGKCWIVFQVDADLFAEAFVICAAGQLQQAAALIAAAVARIDVSKVLAALVGSARGEFLGRAQARSLVNDLREKMRDAEPGVDLVLLESALNHAFDGADDARLCFSQDAHVLRSYSAYDIPIDRNHG